MGQGGSFTHSTRVQIQNIFRLRKLASLHATCTVDKSCQVAHHFVQDAHKIPTLYKRREVVSSVSILSSAPSSSFFRAKQLSLFLGFRLGFRRRRRSNGELFFFECFSLRRRSRSISRRAGTHRVLLPIWIHLLRPRLPGPPHGCLPPICLRQLRQPTRR